MSSGVLFFDIAAAGYAIAFFVFVVRLALKHGWIERVASWLLFCSFLAQTVGLALRGASVGTLPVTNTYESLVFYGWVFALGYTVLIMIARVPERVRSMIGAAVCLLITAFMALASSPLLSPAVVPLVPALRSQWLALHVSFVFIGEGFFTIAFVSSLLYLFGSRDPKRSEHLDLLDKLAYRAIAIGFPFFTLGGLFFGAIWAKHAWGRYWGWDPKETFMLVTWLVYVLYLHMRIQRDWRGRRTAWIAVAGFLLALFTFAGVNYLVRGLHSYG
jgi:cytochrome c-type biogenesis protein CcsB